MPDNATTKRFETLLSEFLDGGLDDERRREFAELLKAESAFSDALVEQLTMDARLTQFETESHDADRFTGTLAATLAAQTDGDEFIDRVVQRAAAASLPPSTNRPTRWRLYVAASVAAIAILGIGWAIGNWTDGPENGGTELVRQADDSDQPEEPTDDGIAVLVHADEVEWPDGDVRQENDILSPGPLRFEKGLLQLGFYSGARLIVEGPADLELVSVDHVICRLGRVRAVVPPPAHGFRVVAPQFELIDLGTEFGLSVDTDGESQVQVFDGEVELVPPGADRSTADVEKLTRGEGRAWTAAGTRVPQQAEPGAFPTFEDLERRKVLAAEKRLARWQAWKDKLAGDPRIAFRFDFESDGLELLDQGPTESHGAIVGAEWTTGRWPSTKALEFKRPGDRVRLNLPGSYDAVTLSAWLRVDSLPGRSQGLLLTDGYEVGRAHWQLNGDGNLRLGVRKPSAGLKGGAAGYGSPVLITPRRLGAWCFLCTVYDRESGTVRHYYDGREVSSDEIVFDQPLQFGTCDLGNWTQDLSNPRYPVRNLIGRIDDLTVWDVALTGQEIHRMFLRTRP